MVFPQNITNGHVNLKLISREFQTHSLSKLMSNPENSHRKCKLPGCLNSLAVNNAPYGGCRRDFSVSPGMETSIGGVGRLQNVGRCRQIRRDEESIHRIWEIPALFHHSQSAAGDPSRE